MFWRLGLGRQTTVLHGTFTHIRKGGMVAGLVAAATMGVAGCTLEATEGEGGEIAVAAAGNVQFLDQGWDDATRASFYQMPQGSVLLPFTWFLHLEQADSTERLRSEANMARQGWLVDPASEANPHGLPVGFTQDADMAGGDALGLTCAACHTGQVEYKGSKLRIDGGQSMGDLEQLQNSIHGSLVATLGDAEKFDRFAANVLGASDDAAARDALRTEMEGMRDWWLGRITRSRGLTPHGPSRTDAFTVIANEVVCELFGIPANCAPAVAPNQFPHLWDTTDFEWVQYNSATHSSLGRNVGQVTGVFAQAAFDPYGIRTSANFENLHALEQQLKLLRSPSWPEEILGEIDDGLAAEGAALYASNCAGCHNPDPARTEPNIYGLTFARIDFSTPVFFGPEEGRLGTDATAAYSFATRRADPGPLRDIAAAYGLIGPDDKVAVPALLSISVSMIIQRFFGVNQLTDLEKITYLGFRESRSPSTAQLLTYKARPLNGIAFTAPYLHNGSVPTLYDLLLPPEERPVTFWVGSREFDPVNVGYITTQDADNSFEFRTRDDSGHMIPGNSNAGHDYDNAAFTEQERRALVEYMKTL